jgi:DNA polymerase elongation subunit (family B)
MRYESNTMSLITRKFFVYDWHTDTEEEITIIRLFGIDMDNKNICVIVEDFTPWVYLELPENITWTDTSLQLLVNALDRLLGEGYPIKKAYMRKYKLFGFEEDAKGNRKTSPFLWMSFSNDSERRFLSYKIKNAIHVPMVGAVQLKCHEHNADPILQLSCLRNLPTAGWIKIVGETIEPKTTTCHEEYKVKYTNLFPEECDLMPTPLILSYDTEVNSSIITKMPDAERPEDKMFQISAVVGRTEHKYDSYLFTLGKCGKIKGVTVFEFDTEADMLEAWAKFIKDINPNIITGYNIMGFDLPYMIDRAKNTFVYSTFDQQNMFIDRHCEEKELKWSSAARKDQKFRYLITHGRVTIDIMPIAKEKLKLSNYKLNTVSASVLSGDMKDPLDHLGIFKCYREGMKGGRKGRKALKVCGRYCVKDSILPYRLLFKLQVWIGNCEMAKVCQVPIMYLSLKGQQIKVFSQIYKLCLKEGYVVQKDAYIRKAGENYQGAKVFEPKKPGLYKNILPFDFKSLYPSAIIDKNLCFSTWIPDSSPIPDEKTNVIEWIEHIGCEHDTEIRKTKPKNILCGHRRYRFLKTEIKTDKRNNSLGILPRVLDELLTSRVRVKKIMKVIKKELKALESEENEMIVAEKDSKDNPLNEEKKTYALSLRSEFEHRIHIRDKRVYSEVLDQRQLALKISCNSVASDTPVPCRINGVFTYKTIEEITDGTWKDEHDNNQVSKPMKDLEVWSDIGFTKVKYVMRHPVRAPLVRVNIHTGSVDCTEEHSLLDKNGVEVKPKDLKIGDELMTRDLPLPDDTPKRVPFETLTEEIIRDYVLGNCEYNGLCEKMAFVWGLIFSEMFSIHKNIQVFMRHEDIQLLERVKCILEEHEPEYEWVIRKNEQTGEFYLMHLMKNGTHPISKVADQYIKLFHDHRNTSRIPDIVFNAPIDIRKAFFIGYCSRKYSKSLFTEGVILTKFGAISSAGLYHLTRTLGYHTTVSHVRNGMYNMECLVVETRENLCSIKSMGYSPLPPPIVEIGKLCVYTNRVEYIYDIETESHHFAAGVGNLIVHNSGYGATGVEVGRLAFMPVAMCTTAVSRELNLTVFNLIPEKFNGVVIYGDTDSNYVYFPHLEGKPMSEVWEHALYVAKTISDMFGDAVVLEFEEEIYTQFLIITKKRYMYYKCYKDGIVLPDMGYKGVLLQRRDNSACIRDVYRKLVDDIFAYDGKSKDKVLHRFCKNYHNIRTLNYEKDDFTITKSVGEIKNYKVRALPTDPVKRAKRLKDLDCNEAEYVYKALPAQAQLSIKMRNRGKQVVAGSRLEYVMTTTGGPKARTYLKVEDEEYYNRHPRSIFLDYMYYMGLLVNQCDQLIEIIYEEPKFTKKLHKNYENFNKSINELDNITKPIIYMGDALAPVRKIIFEEILSEDEREDEIIVVKKVDKPKKPRAPPGTTLRYAKSRLLERASYE